MHAHPHDHHGDAHSHREAAGIGRPRLVFVLAMTAVFMIVELVGGWLANSLALIADAGHMLGDVGALGLSVFALWVSRRPATRQKSYGYLRIEILAALANGVTLVVIALTILWQAWRRFVMPEPVEAGLMLAVAAAGLVVNAIAALLLHRASGHNLNVRGAYLHVLGDLLGSAGAVTAALIILFTAWTPADPLVSCFVALLILGGSWRLVRESVDILLEATPRHIDLDAVQRAIAAIPGVLAVHDLHVWTLTSGVIAMSGHAMIDGDRPQRDILDAIHERMHQTFGVSHVTVQLEERPLYTIGRDE
ncbi:MAG: cation diffusion facilitator family transporter [Gemmatimonadetes bacterium]|nr:cation diffusion facilitator family transporter [Gemmatimonadota bacterium]